MYRFCCIETKKKTKNNTTQSNDSISNTEAAIAAPHPRTMLICFHLSVCPSGDGERVAAAGDVCCEEVIDEAVSS